MNRFSVIYLFQKQFHHISCATHTEAEALLMHLLTQEDHQPFGVYDAKTELFVWEPTRKDVYDKATMEEQGKSDAQVVQIAQQLRQPGNSFETEFSNHSQLLASAPINEEALTD